LNRLWVYGFMGKLPKTLAEKQLQGAETTKIQLNYN